MAILYGRHIVILINHYKMHANFLHSIYIYYLNYGYILHFYNIKYNLEQSLLKFKHLNVIKIFLKDN